MRRSLVLGSILCLLFASCGGDEQDWQEVEDVAGKGDSDADASTAMRHIQSAMLSSVLPGGCSVQSWTFGRKRVDFLMIEASEFCAKVSKGDRSRQVCVADWPGPEKVETRDGIVRYHYYSGDLFSHEIVNVEIDRQTGAVVYLQDVIGDVE